MNDLEVRDVLSPQHWFADFWQEVLIVLLLHDLGLNCQQWLRLEYEKLHEPVTDTSCDKAERKE